MPHRNFVDRDGIQWNVWDTRPQWADRRVNPDRRVTPVDDDTVDPPVLERRRCADRRQGVSDGLRRVKLGGGMSGGWLTFESERERRRLSPIPAGWEDAPQNELAGLCARAAAAHSRGRSPS
jgi:hypothetical protein